MSLFECSDIEHLSEREQREVARTLEFCSTHTDGIKLLFSNKTTVFKILKQAFRQGVDEKSILYASATVLLDLTANESCIEPVATLMQEHGIFAFVVEKLHELMEKKPKDSQY